MGSKMDRYEEARRAAERLYPKPLSLRSASNTGAVVDAQASAHEQRRVELRIYGHGAGTLILGESDAIALAHWILDLYRSERAGG